MKTLKNVCLLAVIAMGMALFACQKEDVKTKEDVREEIISQESALKLAAMGLNPNGLYKKLIDFPDGIKKEMYIVEGDIMISQEQLDCTELQEREGPNGEQYFSVNVHNNIKHPRTIKIKTHPLLDSTWVNALSYAIDHLNSLNLYLTFALTTANDEDIRIDLAFDPNINPYTSPQPYILSGYGSVKHLWPYPYIKIYNGNFPPLSHTTPTVQRALMLHSICHSISMGHNDWRGGQSCNSQNPNIIGFDEIFPGDYVYYDIVPTGTVTFVPKVPNTPDGYYSEFAIMNKCMSFDVVDTLDQYDIIALEYYYGY